MGTEDKDGTFAMGLGAQGGDCVGGGVQGGGWGRGPDLRGGGEGPGQGFCRGWGAGWWCRFGVVSDGGEEATNWSESGVDFGGQSDNLVVQAFWIWVGVVGVVR